MVPGSLSGRAPPARSGLTAEAPALQPVIVTCLPPQKAPAGGARASLLPGPGQGLFVAWVSEQRSRPAPARGCGQPCRPSQRPGHPSQTDSRPLSRLSSLIH